MNILEMNIKNLHKNALDESNKNLITRLGIKITDDNEKVESGSYGQIQSLRSDSSSIKYATLCLKSNLKPNIKQYIGTSIDDYKNSITNENTDIKEPVYDYEYRTYNTDEYGPREKSSKSGSLLINDEEFKNKIHDLIFNDLMRYLCEAINYIKKQYLHLSELREYYNNRSKYVEESFNIKCPSLDPNNLGNVPNDLMHEVYLFLDNSKTKIIMSLLVLRTIIRKRSNKEVLTEDILYAIKYVLKDAFDYQIVLRDKLCSLKINISTIFQKTEESFNTTKSFERTEFENILTCTKSIYKSINNCSKKSTDIQSHLENSLKLIDYVMMQHNFIPNLDIDAINENYKKELQKPISFRCEMALNTSKLFESFDIKMFSELTNLAIYEVVNEIDQKSTDLSAKDSINLSYLFINKLKDEIRSKVIDDSQYAITLSFIRNESEYLDSLDPSNEKFKEIKKQIESAKYNLRLSITEMVSKELESDDDLISSQVSNKIKSIFVDISKKIAKIENYTNKIEKLFSTFYIFNIDSSETKDSVPKFTENKMPPDLCSICLQFTSTDDTTNYIKLECDHVFHRFCLDEWLIKNKTCPNCRSHESNYYQTKLFEIGVYNSFNINKEHIDREYKKILSTKDSITLDLKRLLYEMEQNHSTIIQIKSSLDLLRYSNFHRPKMNLYLILLECFFSELDYIYSPIKDIKLLMCVNNELSRISGLEPKHK